VAAVEDDVLAIMEGWVKGEMHPDSQRKDMRVMNYNNAANWYVSAASEILALIHLEADRPRGPAIDESFG
jgi:hypothetical protein